MIGWFRQAMTLLQARQRRRVYLMMLTAAAASVVQVLSILAIMPFIILLANPDGLAGNRTVTQLADAVGADSYQDFLIVFAALAIVVLTLGNLFVAFEVWMSHRFRSHLRESIQRRMLRRMLRKPCEYFVANHSATLSDVILHQVDRVVDGVIGEFVSVIRSVALAGFIVLLLLVVSVQTTLVTLAGLLAAYLGVFLLLRRRVEAHGEALTGLSASTFAAIKETLDGVREVKTRRAQEFFGRRFDRSAVEMARLEVRYGIMSYLPHFLLEAIVFSGFVGVALYFLVTTDDAGVSLSYLALYGMAVYRLVPALQGIFEGITAVHHNADAVLVVLEHWEDTVHHVEPRELRRPLREIRLEGVTYRYAGSEGPQVDAVSLKIPVGSSVCLFGPSGSGKTTILGLLSGLIHPQSGRVCCDDQTIGPDTVDSWRRCIGYAPQQIYLFADTIASNIAFGVPPEEVDFERVVAVSRLANLDDFVSSLPDGYRTLVGEHGATLSGGQCRRIGIARVLYHDPDVLLLDESFAGLDVGNRAVILDNLFALKDKTLVFSSHEVEIASRCDNVAVIEEGKLSAEGDYCQLQESSARFAALLTRLESLES